MHIYRVHLAVLLEYDSKTSQNTGGVVQAVDYKGFKYKG
jgi:hypothetical protein